MSFGNFSFISLKLIGQKNENEESKSENKIISSSDGLSCRYCNIPSFISKEEQRAHFKTDSHIDTLQNFMLADSSFSMENEENFSSAEPIILFQRDDRPETYAVYKAIFFGRKDERYRNAQLVDIEDFKSFIIDPGLWALFIISGGRFSGGIFDVLKKQVICQKTIHRYTVRKGQGKSQSKKDNSTGKAHSAGATLRRYNENALLDDIAQITSDWAKDLNTCKLIFVNRTGQKSLGILGDNVRYFPFATGKAIFENVQIAFDRLSQIRRFE